MPELPIQMMQLYCERFSEVPLAVLNTDGTFIHANTAFRRRMNLSETPVGASIHTVLDISLEITDPIYHDEDKGICADLVTASYTLQGELVKLRGHLFFDQKQYMVIFDIFKQHDVEILEQVTKMNLEMTSMTRDYSKQYRRMNIEAQQQKKLAGQDQLTRLPNRRHFEEAAHRLMTGKEKPKLPSFGIILLDIDNFKRVNDTYGHDVGDKVLVKLSETVQEQIRADDVPARYGGEEFIILARCETLEQLEKFAEKLRSAFASLHIEEISSSVTASFGITMHHAGDSLAAMIKRADTALYKAKKDGKNRVEAIDEPKHQRE